MEQNELEAELIIENMTLQNLPSTIESLLSQNKIEEAFTLLISYFTSENYKQFVFKSSGEDSLTELEDTFKTVIIKSASFHRLYEAFLKGIIDWKTFDIDNNSIVYSLLNILDILKRIANNLEKIDWDKRNISHILPPFHLYESLKNNTEVLLKGFENLLELLDS